MRACVVRDRVQQPLRARVAQQDLQREDGKRNGEEQKALCYRGTTGHLRRDRPAPGRRERRHAGSGAQEFETGIEHRRRSAGNVVSTASYHVPGGGNQHEAPSSGTASVQHHPVSPFVRPP